MKKTLISTAIGLMCAFGAQANEMVDQDGNIVMGYWHNWCDGAGYQGGNAPCFDLTTIDTRYNVVAVSFMKVYDYTNPNAVPTFQLDTSIISEDDFKAQIELLNSQGRSVILALGGADAHVEMKTGQEQDFANEIIRLTDEYGFDGLDIDLEQAAITAADNQTVIPAALRIVKDHYREQGKNFLITMAPEFPYLTQGGHYRPYIEGLEGYYDWINPQFYNQGGDGLWVDELSKWLSQSSDEDKEDFIYYISDSLANGTRGFGKIPHDKLVFGLPTNIDAAATGYVIDPQALYNAFERLEDAGQPLRGLMTWSVNWDMGTDSAGNSYNSEFIKDYGDFIHGGENPEPSPVPVFNGINDTRVRIGQSFDYLAGITAKDSEGNDITSSITYDGYVDTARTGTYIITYTVQDSEGNEAVKPRSVEVYAVLPTLSGVDNISVKQFDDFNPMAGVTATDADGNDLTQSIQVTGEVDTSVVGDYELTYSVTDQHNQSSEEKRTVRVYEDTPPPPPGEYPEWIEGGNYQLGDVVIGADGKLYECTGNGQWCGQSHNKPGVSGLEHWWESTWTLADGSIAPPPGETPPGEHPAFEPGKNYNAGDIVTGADGDAYQCKPWPATGWCSSAAYAPGNSLYWADAWDKL
ncbi:immunoglobulin-like domain-containing protein [uncultured Vibrio sp.]|uniref:immunoglobulin-like domain-containing protein n=1 Tax=uncultured Vibrio sp. TaxID=114054 RepID=UPI00262C9881|nr:immunoglobulin-like domain-containing protein [uncultured Vibrio sp.]